ncbi:MAG: DNA polymerase III subunit beta [Alicyclobacillus sp.]|nr:DNA polymerase III subunit beta [Alicyclobacillus sp.]
MKIQISQPLLLHMIQTVSKAVAVRTPKPALTGILIQAMTSKLVVTAYDLELGIQSTAIPEDSNALRIDEPGAIVLTARYFTDIVRKLPTSDVHIQVRHNYMTEIRSGQAEFHLHGIDAADFPKLPVLERATSVEIESKSLKTAIQTTSFAASTVESRPILTGIHMVGALDTLTFTATDALRLATTSTQLAKPFPENEWNGVIPSKSLAELARILPDDDSVVSIQLTDTHSMFEIGSTLFYTRLLDGSYPDTSRIIPTSHKTKVTVTVEDIEGAIDRAALIARDREVRMEVSTEFITVSSSSPEIGNLSEQIPVLEKEGDDLLISFNAKYVLDAVKALNEHVITFYFNGSNQPFIIRGTENPATIQLISPVLMR